MKSIIIKVIIIWTFLFTIDLLLLYFDIYSEYLILDNILKLLRILYVLICPLTILLLIAKLKTLRFMLIVIWSISFVIMFFPIWLILVFSVSDLQNNNGYRPIFEKQLDKNKFFTVYRSPDMGAFGGDNIVYAIDKKLMLGFMQRHILTVGEYQSESIQNKEQIYIGKDTIILGKMCDE